MAHVTADRLVQQLVLFQQRDGELLQQSRRLAQLAAEKQTLADREATAVQERDKLVQLREKLTAQKVQQEAAHAEQAKEDERLRKILSDELAASIAAINARMETETTERETTMRDNARYKEKIAAFKDSLSTGGDKFAELMVSGQAEATALTARLSEEERLQGLLITRNQQLDEQIAAATVEHDALKARVDDFVERFTAVQKTLSDANAQFAKAKRDQERLVKRVTGLEAECGDCHKRTIRSMVERDAEKALVEKHEKQAATLEAQIAKLEGLMTMLRSQL
jgi:hypothetical protein